MKAPRFHYSPYVVETSAESVTCVTTVGSVRSYGIPADPDGLEVEPAAPSECESSEGTLLPLRLHETPPGEVRILTP